MATTISGTPALKDLVRAVNDILSQEGDSAQRTRWIAGALRKALGDPDLLTPEQRQSNPQGYHQHVLHADEDGRFSIVALVWLPGQSTSVHDHLSWAVVGVHQGCECEVQYKVLNDGGPFLMSIGESTHRQGTISILQPPGDIHTVYNPGPETAISIHIYGADVRKTGSSIRCRYDLPVVETLPASFRRRLASAG
jgi:predicted metal-dependent enzyme (double-stranded beta helix superfamily)